jgi:DNA replication and repair protein RecF
MSLLRLNIAGFRNLSDVRLILSPDGFNYFYGKNGSGKTSLVESVFYMIYGRSFRTPNVSSLIHHTTTQFSVFSEMRPGDHLPHYPLGVERWRDGRLQVRAGGENVSSFAGIARRFPVLLAHAGSHHLMEAGPLFRRKYLDWGAFYQHGDFLVIWKRYARALRQRNTLLRKKQWGAELDTWSLELIKSGTALDAARRRFVETLLPCLTLTLGELLNLPDLKITYQSGWLAGLSFAEAIENAGERDRQLGCTQAGPHRADFKMTIKGMPARERLSRGQQKLFIYAMIVAQGALIQQSLDNPPVYLLDDLPAELDGDSQTRLMTLLQAQKAQVLFTGIQPEVYQSSHVKMFHVEHGGIRERQCV